MIAKIIFFFSIKLGLIYLTSKLPYLSSNWLKNNVYSKNSE